MVAGASLGVSLARQDFDPTRRGRGGLAMISSRPPFLVANAVDLLVKGPLYLYIVASEYS